MPPPPRNTYLMTVRHCMEFVRHLIHLDIKFENLCLTVLIFVRCQTKLMNTAIISFLHLSVRSRNRKKFGWHNVSAVQIKEHPFTYWSDIKYSVAIVGCFYCSGSKHSQIIISPGIDQGSLFLTWVNLNPIMNKYLRHFQSAEWNMKFLYHSQTNACTVEVWEWINNFTRLYRTCNYLM